MTGRKKNKSARILIPAFFLCAAVLFLLAGGVSVRAETIGYYTSAPGAAVSKNADGGIKASVSVPESGMSTPVPLAEYTEAVDISEPILLYLNPLLGSGNAVTNRYISVYIYGNEGRTALNYHFSVSRQSAGAVNCWMGGGYWGDKPSGGMDEYKIVVSEDGLRSYINDSFIEFWAVGKGSFGNGKAYISFGAGMYWWGSAGEQAADIRVGNPSAVEEFRGFSTQQQAAWTYSLSLRGAQISDIYIVGSAFSAVLDKNRYSVTDALLSIDPAYIIGLCGNAAGSYTLRLVNTAKDIYLRLRISHSAEIEIEEGLLFDKHSGGTGLFAEVYRNTDTFVSLSGSGISSGDYTLDDSLLFIGADFLRSLPVGRNELSVVSALSQGIPFYIDITDTSPPEAKGGVPVFDGYAPEDIRIDITAYQNSLVSFSGNGITESGFSYAADTGVMNINKEFLSALAPNGRYTFVFEGTYGSTEVAVDTIYSRPAELIAALIARANIRNPIDAVFSFDIKYDFFTEVSGNGIGPGNYSFDPGSGRLTVRREFISGLGTGSRSFNFKTKYNAGGIPFIITVFDAASPELLSGTAPVTADKQSLSSLSYTVRLNGASFIWIELAGGGVLERGYHYTAGGDTAEITLRADYLKSLPVGGYTFRIVFDNGEIDAGVNLTNSLSAHFTGGSDKIYLTADTGEDFGVNIAANGGLFEYVSGNGITAADYYIDGETVYLRKEYIAALPGLLDEYFTFKFDNATLSAYIAPPPKSDPLELYLVEGADAAAEGEWIRVTYEVVNGQGVLLGGVKVKYLFDVTAPIKIQVDMVQTSQKAGYPFVFTISPDAYKLYYGEDPSPLFGAFEVGQSYLTGAFFGKSGVHDAPSSQIQHELLSRKGDPEEFVFDIGEHGTNIYYNGRLIRSTPLVTRADFPDGRAYVLFSPFTWTQPQDETDTLIYRFRANGRLKGETDFVLYNTLVTNDIVINAFSDGGVIAGVYLIDGAEELPLTGYTVDYDYAYARAAVTFRSDAILYNPLMCTPGSYTLRIKNSLSYFDVTLRVSDSRFVEIVSAGSPVFDAAGTGDLFLSLMLNLDGFTGLSGSGIADGDYSYSAGRLTVSREFLGRFDTGSIGLLLHSLLGAEGRPFEIFIIDTEPPVVIGESVWKADLSAPADIVFRIDLKKGSFSGFEGEGPGEGQYAFDSATGTLTVSYLYAGVLSFGDHELLVRIYYGAGVYSTLSFTVSVGNSVPPAFSNGEGALTARHYFKSGEAIIFRTTANKGRFIGIEGGGISPDAYTYDAESGAITIFAKWADLLPAGESLFYVVFDSGNLRLSIIAAETEGGVPFSEEHGYGGYIAGTASALAILIGAAVFFFVVRYKRGGRKPAGRGE
jgi:hypothetical protein